MDKRLLSGIVIHSVLIAAISIIAIANASFIGVVGALGMASIVVANFCWGLEKIPVGHGACDLFLEKRRETAETGEGWTWRQRPFESLAIMDKKIRTIDLKEMPVHTKDPADILVDVYLQVRVSNIFKALDVKNLFGEDGEVIDGGTLVNEIQGAIREHGAKKEILDDPSTKSINESVVVSKFNGVMRSLKTQLARMGVEVVGKIRIENVQLPPEIQKAVNDIAKEKKEAEAREIEAAALNKRALEMVEASKVADPTNPMSFDEASLRVAAQDGIIDYTHTGGNAGDFTKGAQLKNRGARGRSKKGERS